MSHECEHHHGRGHRGHGRGPSGGMQGFRPPFGPGMGAWGPGAFGPGAGWGGHRGHRARRGDVRTGILVLLADKPMHGYQIIQEASERSGGTWRPSPGSVYPTLQLLEDEGLITSSEADGKKVYEISEAGTAALAERGDAKAPWEEAAGSVPESAMALRQAMMQTGAAAMQAGAAGSEDQVSRVVEILDRARKEIYGILAEDTPKGE